jgi:hypothetical protein
MDSKTASAIKHFEKAIYCGFPGREPIERDRNAGKWISKGQRKLVRMDCIALRALRGVPQSLAKTAAAVTHFEEAINQGLGMRSSLELGRGRKWAEKDERRFVRDLCEALRVLRQTHRLQKGDS